jgi:methyltransferase
VRLAIYVILALVAVQRLAEVVYANHNTKALLARGAVEIGRKHYPLIVLLHTAWLAAILLFLPVNATIHWVWFALFLILQGLRVWVLATLGPYWTTRIINLPGAPLVRKGPFRFVRHPNYTVVAGEIAALPLAFGEWQVAAVFTVLNGLMLAWRIRAEDAALSARRQAAHAG